MSYNVDFIKSIEVKKEKTVLEIAKENKIKIKSPCEKGKCGKCKVRILEGKVSEPTKNEIKLLGQEKIDEGLRLACETQVLGDVKVSF